MKGPERQSIRKIISIFSIFVFICAGRLSAQSSDTIAPKKSFTYQQLIRTDKLFLAPLPAHSIMHKKFNYLKVYHDNLGIFCKAENKASKHAPVQLRMRLGSLDYVNKLEGK